MPCCSQLLGSYLDFRLESLLVATQKVIVPLLVKTRRHLVGVDLIGEPYPVFAELDSFQQKLDKCVGHAPRCADAPIPAGMHADVTPAWEIET